MIGTPLDQLAQLSSINDILNCDVDKDGLLDIIVAGNLYGSEVETPRNDAGYGMFLKGSGTGFKAWAPSQSGLLIDGEVKHIQLLKSKTKKTRLFLSGITTY